MAAASDLTLVDYLVPRRVSRSLNLLRDGLLVIGFSLFTALCAHISFPLPFTPVPVTLQTLAVLLTGAALGSRRGGLALLLYLAEGAAGLPVFSPIPSGPGGIAALLGITAGYLWSFPIAAFVTGWLCERQLDRSILTSALAMLPGTLITYLIGVSWLAVALHLDAGTAIKLGMLPFIPGDLLKLLIAAALLPTTWSVVRRVKPDLHDMR